MLKQTFIGLTTKYKVNFRLTEKLWDEIYLMHSEKFRHYHTLSHLNNLLSILEKVKNEIKDWDAVLFAIYFHDIIYNTTSNQNEEESAEFAKIRLTELSVPQDQIIKCLSMILATKGHCPTDENDTNYFTDADLSILGQSWDTYLHYSKQVRLEYSSYPDLIYNSGRKKVLSHFLSMNRIYKTPYFFDKFEKQAKENLINELKSL